MSNVRAFFCFVVFFFLFFISSSSVFANNLNISNVRLGIRDPQAKTVKILFDVSWDNSWRNKINHDAVWFTVRLSDAQAVSGEKRLCKLTVAGLLPAGSSAGSSSNAELLVPLERTGAFIRPAGHQEVSTFVSTDVTVTVDYSTAGFSENATIAASVVGMEMVLVPEGSFYAGDFAASTASFRQGAADNDPWEVSSAAPLSVTAADSNGYYYVSAGNAGEFPTGSSFTIPQDFPKGFSAFYAMKYEVTEGLWVDFVNSLPAAARTARDLTNAAHKNSDSVLYRNSIACSGSPLVCSSQRPFRALNYVSWKDLSAFLDWAGLRPMTELEFEKAARGPSVPLPGSLAFGGVTPVAVTGLSGNSEDGKETVSTQDANASFGDQVLSGGDAANGAGYQKGPLRSGIFSTSTSTRTMSGAGYYGMMELSGNLKEWVVTVGSASGLGFTGKNGDGYLTTLSGFEGNADVESWPGLDVNAARGVTSAAGTGFRGGSWQDSIDRLRISDRAEAALSDESAGPSYGGRGARTVDTQ
ncbi:MAG: SUMF1/EgtB/PvdO family nonheme iron enzyme [Candidatus Omnitrophota bacterium]